jgi:copper chaperone CopZ
LTLKPTTEATIIGKAGAEPIRYLEVGHRKIRNSEVQPMSERSLKLGTFEEDAAVRDAAECGCCAPAAAGADSTAREATSGPDTVTLSVPDIVCEGCARSIRSAVGQVAGVSRVEVDVSAKTVSITHDRGTPRGAFVAALEGAGYSVA